MPIPTRSASLREPRKPVSPLQELPAISPAFQSLRNLQSSTIARPVTNTKTTTTGTIKPPARSTTDKTRPPSNPSPVEGASVKDNGTSQRGRTLLPQRSNNSVRDEGQNFGEVKLRPTESKARPRGETSPKRQPHSSSVDEKKDSGTVTTSTSVHTRRQSLMRPGALRVASTTKTNASAPTKGAATTFAPPSPHKQTPLRSPAQPSTQRPPSPKKTDMPPPQRPVRSASLRQFPGSTGPPAATRGHARHRSQMVPSTAKSMQPDPAPVAQKSRPQFSTYQQHYSPKKPTKPPTPTPGAAPGSDGLLIPTSWPDIAALQTELLQLSLFHSNSLQKHIDWKADSETRLRKKYDGVAGQYRSMLGEEKRRQSQLNAEALNCWLQNCRDHRGPHGFPEQIQILSQVLQEVSDLGTSGLSGRYSRAVETFETWFQEAEFVRHHRESSEAVDGNVFLDPLDQSWKEEIHALHLKLEHCGRQLQSLDILGFGEVERLEQSALARVAHGLADSIKLMMQEIRAMRTLEAELVRAERVVVSRLVTQLAALREKSAPRVGVWST